MTKYIVCSDIMMSTVIAVVGNTRIETIERYNTIQCFFDIQKAHPLKQGFVKSRVNQTIHSGSEVSSGGHPLK
ncbi:MAG: hypothetical protein PHH85_09385 [Candidatus Methanoperedens sp.]|nr:hypothetical protein [Candidatus Methanoperedens sp.]